MAYSGAKRPLRKAAIRLDDAGYADDERAHTERAEIRTDR
jgi:hypothetical protein